MSSDPRLGFRDGTGTITTVPSQYADGTEFSQQTLPQTTLVFLDDNNFAALAPGITQLTSAQRAALEAVAGTEASISSLSNLRTGLSIEPISSFTLFDEFDTGALNTDKWATDVNGTASAVAAATGTGLTVVNLTSGTDDDGHATLASVPNFLSSAGTVLLEARLRLNTVSDVGFEIGLTDAASETGGQTFTSVDETPVAVASNAAILSFLSDTAAGETNTNWSAVTVNAGTAAFDDTSIAATTNFIDVAIAFGLDSGNSEVDVTFFVNGAAVASQAAAVATDTTLYAWASVKAFEGSVAKTVDIDYIRITQGR